MAAAGSRLAVITLFFCLLLLLLPDALVSHLVSGSLDTNEIVDAPALQQEEPDLPQCRPASACGYLQVNAFGVNSLQFCSCGGGRLGEGAAAGRRDCGLHWDPQDGRSVTMGDKQFKYCEPPPALRVCGRQEPAYTAAYLFHKTTFSLVGERHMLHCLCPPPHTHQRSDTLQEEVLEERELVMATVHTCATLPVCATGEACKEVSVGGGGTALVNVKCRCPRFSACPTLTHDPTPDTNTYPRGTAYSVHCVPLY